MADPIYVPSGDSKLFKVEYPQGISEAARAALEAGWSRFNRLDPNTGKTWYIWYRSSNYKQQVTVNFSMPASAPLGLYRVEVFVPGKNATSIKAMYSVANKFRTENGQLVWEDTLASVDMSHVYDQWVSLGEYVLEPGNQPLSGRVRQFDLTQENPPTRITFGPVRWVPLFIQGGGGEGSTTGSGGTAGGGTTGAGGGTTGAGGGTTGTTGGGSSTGPRFDFPIGTSAQRAAPISEGKFMGTMPLWLSDWYDANPFLSLYFLGYHTGADLNSTVGREADADAPIYAVGDGTVTFVGPSSGSWGNIILISHPDAQVTLPNGVTRRQRVFSRYGHVSPNILVTKGQAVTRGQQIGHVGLMAGYTSNHHLHFDMGYSEIFLTQPGHWPDTKTWQALDKGGQKGSKEWNMELAKIKGQILANYLDPLKFIKDNH